MARLFKKTCEKAGISPIITGLAMANVSLTIRRPQKAANSTLTTGMFLFNRSNCCDANYKLILVEVGDIGINSDGWVVC